MTTSFFDRPGAMRFAITALVVLATIVLYAMSIIAKKVWGVDATDIVTIFGTLAVASVKGFFEAHNSASIGNGHNGNGNPPASQT